MASEPTKKIEDLPGIKESEFVDLGTCAVCRKHLIDGRQLTFYRVTIERCAWDARAISRRLGLAAFVGSGAIARVMGPDEDLAKIFMGPVKLVVHEDCAHGIGSLLELMAKPEEAST